MVWVPAKTATPPQQRRAVELLHSPDWKLGLIAEEGGVQYHGAFHPNYPNTPQDPAAPAGKHRGVEVWVEKDATPATGVTTAMTAPWKPDASRTASAEERELVLREFESRGWPRDEAAAMVAIESGWDATARNVQRFGGLIGFSPTLQKKWGVFPVWETHPTAAQQAPLVGRYLDEVVTRKWRYPGDTYMTGAAPSFVGATDGTVVYPKGSKAWEQNKGWRPPDDGDITAGSIRATLLRKLRKGGAGPAPPPKATTPPPDTQPGPSQQPWSSSLFWRSLLTALREAPSGARHLAALAPSVRNVVADYQRSAGLRDDGQLGPTTLARLLDDDDP